MKRAVLALLFLSQGPAVAIVPASDIAQGVQAYHERRYADAMAVFLQILGQDPGNSQAHTYTALIAQNLRTRYQTETRDARLHVLADSSSRLESGHLNSKPLDDAILDTTQAEERGRQERWKSLCEEAEVEAQLGHLVTAHDRVLRVLGENSSYPPAQQVLSELQVRLYRLLSSGQVERAEERYVLEGYYAYGQAEYETAAAAWSKADTLIRQSYPSAEAAQHFAALRFIPYFQIAQAHVDDSQRTAKLHQAFQLAVSAYERGEYEPALEQFRQIAILNPDYPLLGDHLARAESAVERERGRKLGEKKQQEITQWMARGTAALEQARFSEAQQAFETVLSIDPTHKQAQNYREMVLAEIHKRHDPRAAQQHYEVGLIAYASGKLEEAIREWTIATRMNPNHEKAAHALSKVQKELALNRELP
jgi:tetratricopeptide (TPR) repeat protein